MDNNSGGGAQGDVAPSDDLTATVIHKDGSKTVIGDLSPIDKLKAGIASWWKGIWS
jgi:hypothetical protein